MVQRVKSFFYNRQLQQLLKESKGGWKNNTQQVLFLLSENQYSEIPSIKEWSKKQFGSHIHSDFIIRTEADLTDYKALSNRFVTWYQGIKSKFIDDLRLKDVDLVINLDSTFDRPLLTLAAYCQAQFRIGFLANEHKIYDLLVEHDSDQVMERLKRISDLLSIIQPTNS